MIRSGARRDDQQRPPQEGSLDTARVTSTLTPGAVDLYWIPLGAGAHVIRLSGTEVGLRRMKSGDLGVNLRHSPPQKVLGVSARTETAIADVEKLLISCRRSPMR